MSDPFGTEKGTPIRMPSTANLMISSYDRNNPSGTTAGQFLIKAKQSLLNGFFTRIATTEIAMNWNVTNIASAYSNNLVVFDISGLGVQSPITLPDGCYTCADALDTIVSLFNALNLGGRSLAVTSTGALVTLTMTGGSFRFPLASNNLIASLGFPVAGAYATTKVAETFPVLGISPSEQLQSILYLDFVSSQLTYNQLLKDASTDVYDRDVLARWYMNYDNDMNQVDKYGYAIKMGMKPFFVRRTFSPPKQIRWSSSQPIGQLGFEVFATYNDGTESQLLLDTNYNWLMTLQVSEV